MSSMTPETLRVLRETRSIQLARKFVISAVTRMGGSGLGERIEPGRLEDVELMTSELVANAVLHGGGEIELRVGCIDGMAWVEVHDDDPRLPKPPPPTRTATAGRGLAIVDAIADRWGCRLSQGGGKTVWFELDLTRPARTLPSVC